MAWTIGGDLYDKRFMVTGSASGSNQSNIQLVYDLADAPAAFIAALQADGDDIRVTQGDGTTQEPFVVKNFNKGAGTGQVIFNASSLVTGGSNFYLYGGNGSVSSLPRSHTYGSDNVPSPNTSGLWMLDEDPSGTPPQIVDLTANAYDLTSDGTMTSGDLINSAHGKALDFDGTDDRISITSAAMNPGTSDRTYEVWFKSRRTISDGTRYMTDHSTAKNGALIWSHPTSSFRQSFTMNVGGTWYSAKVAGGDLSIDTLYYMAGVYDTSGVPDVIRVYLDGAQSGSDVTVSGSPSSTDDGFAIANAFPAGFFDGEILEVRFSTIARTTNWITTTYNNMDDPGTFWTTGAVNDGFSYIARTYMID
jgi:hypothetical protein